MLMNSFKIQSFKGGGWHARNDNALDPFNGASLLEGARGGEPCYYSKQQGNHGQSGFGGFGGGGGGCKTGGKNHFTVSNHS